MGLRKMKSTQLIVWGVILVVLGLGMAGWGGFRTFQEISAWQSARSELESMNKLTPAKIAELQHDAEASGNFAEGFLGSMLSSPMFLNIAKAKAENEMTAANQNLYSDLPLALVGLSLLVWGNSMLGRAKKAD